MSHDHLTFFKHSEKNSNIGGFDIPHLIDSQGSNNEIRSSHDNKSLSEKLIDVVDFLQGLSPGQKVI